MNTKISSITLLAAIQMTILVPAVTSAQGNYDRQAAYNYAQKYYEKVCSDGYFFRESATPTYLGAENPVPTDVVGYDCAHFVSCCIGNEQNEQGGGLEVPRDYSPNVYGYVSSARLLNWLVSEGGGTKVHEGNNPALISVDEYLQEGDVIAYDWDQNDKINHLALYLGNNRAASHSRSWNEDWRLGHSENFRYEFYHIPVSGTEDPVYFADANLKAAVEEELCISNPTPTDMLGLYFLRAVLRGIVDLTGLEYATNLTSLDLGFYGNKISDISALRGLTNLRFLDLSYNQISDISPLSGLTNLTRLYLSINRISDISPLSGLTKLSDLRLRHNQIGDISPLSGLTNLELLTLGFNEISDISALSGLTNLANLDLEWNHQISDISALSGLTNLHYLDLRENMISEISALSGLTNLWYLWLYGNPLNRDAHCVYIPIIRDNNPGIRFYYGTNPYVCSIPVLIDIKPGTYPNTINLRSRGLVPVAILSTDFFDATTVDPDTVELAGSGVAVRGKHNKLMAHEVDVNGDNLVDLLVLVLTENIDPDSVQDGYAVLTGNLLEEFGGTPIEGLDEITIVSPEQ